MYISQLKYALSRISAPGFEVVRSLADRAYAETLWTQRNIFSFNLFVGLFSEIHEIYRGYFNREFPWRLPESTYEILAGLGISRPR